MADAVRVGDGDRVERTPTLSPHAAAPCIHVASLYAIRIDGASTLQAFMPPIGDGLRVAHRVGLARAADLEVRAAAPVLV